MKTYLLQSPDGEITEPYSVAAGLDYPGVGPEHSYLKDMAEPSMRVPRTKKHWQPLNFCHV